MEKFRIEKLEGTIAFVQSIKVEQINTKDFIIFRVEDNTDIDIIKDIIDKLKLKGVDKTFLILPKTIEYCVFKKED